MASGITNRGKFLIKNSYFRAQNTPTNLYVALVDASVAPGPDTNTLSQLGEVPAGNGYTAGGIQLNRNTTDFDTLTENDTDDRGELKLKDLVWTASGGNLPASGAGARYAVLTTDEATVGDRQVIAYWDLVSNRVVSDTQTLTLVDCELRFTE